MVHTLTDVLGRAGYFFLALCCALSAIAAAALVPNAPLVSDMFGNQAIPLGTKFAIVGSLLLSLTTNFTIASLMYTLVIALLLGINIALTMFYFRRRNRQLAHSGTALGILGMLSGLFGLGCAACGTFALAALFGTAGGAAFVGLLPFHGTEFGIAGVIFSAAATYILLRQIAKPQVCEPVF